MISLVSSKLLAASAEISNPKSPQLQIFALVGYDQYHNPTVSVCITSSELETLYHEIAGTFGSLLRHSYDKDSQGRILWSRTDHRMLKKIIYYLKNQGSLHLTLGSILGAEDLNLTTFNQLQITCDMESLKQFRQILDVIKEFYELEKDSSFDKDCEIRLFSTPLVCTCQEQVHFFEFTPGIDTLGKTRVTNFKRYLSRTRYEGEYPDTIIEIKKIESTKKKAFSWPQYVDCVKDGDLEKKPTTAEELATILEEGTTSKKIRFLIIPLKRPDLCVIHRKCE